MASYKIRWNKSAVKELRKLDKSIITKIVRAVDFLANDPFPRGTKKLISSKNIYRLRVSDYRIVYSIFQNQLIINIIKVAHRKDAYK